MKRYILLLLITVAFTGLHAQSWSTYQKSNPSYSFEMPGVPTMQDTLNLRFAWLKTDSMTVFQVMEIKDVPMDSANANFIAALEITGGDTLRALVGTISSSNGAMVTSSLAVNTFPNYQGLEVCLKYNEPISGRILMVYSRYFYSNRELLTFSVTGAQDDLSTLQANKSQFFNSINLQ